MELLYILLIIVGILCFFHSIKYIFRDTNRLYHYQEDYQDDSKEDKKVKEHMTTLDAGTRSIMRYNIENTTMNIKEYHTILLSNMNILENIDGNEASDYESSELLGIYNYIDINDYAQFVKLHPMNRNDKSNKSHDDIITGLISTLSNILSNDTTTSWQPENITVYYKYSNSDDNKGNCNEYNDKIHLLIFNNIKSQNDTSEEYYNIYVTDYLWNMKYSLKYKNNMHTDAGDSFNLKLMNDNIYKKLLNKSVSKISKKILYSSLNAFVDIKKPDYRNADYDTDEPSSDSTNGQLFMYGINRYHESYYIDKKMIFRNIDLSPKFNNHPHSLYLHYKNTAPDVFDRWLQENDSDSDSDIMNIYEIDDLRDNNSLNKIFDGTFTLLHETDNNLIYINNKYNTYIKLILKNDSVNRDTNNNSVGFFRYNDMDLTFDMNYKKDYKSNMSNMSNPMPINTQNDMSIMEEEEEEYENDYDIEIRKAENEKMVIEKVLENAKDVGPGDESDYNHNYLNVLFSEFNIYVGYINYPIKSVKKSHGPPEQYISLDRAELLNYINDNKNNYKRGFIDLYRLCFNSGVVSFMYMDEHMSVNTDSIMSPPPRPPINIKYNMIQYFEDNEIEYKVYTYPANTNIRDIISFSNKKLELSYGKLLMGSSIYNITTKLDKVPLCIGFIVDSFNDINDNIPTDIKYTPLMVPDRYSNKYDLHYYINNIIVHNGEGEEVGEEEADESEVGEEEVGEEEVGEEYGEDATNGDGKRERIKGNYKKDNPPPENKIRLFIKKKYLNNEYDGSLFTNTIESTKDTIYCSLYGNGCDS